MDAFGDLSGIWPAVRTAVSGVLVLFFIISPIVGGLWARQIRNRTTLVIAGGLFLLLADVIFTVVVALGREAASPADVSDIELFIIGLLIGVVIAWPVTRALAWAMDGPPAYDPTGELRHLNTPQATLMPQQEKRIKRLQKKRR